MRVFLHFILTVVKDNDLHVKIFLLNINYLGHGTCIGYDVCQCNVSWSGAACNIPDCSAANNCSGQGNCIGVNSCSCYPLFDGKDCSQKAAKNLHAPVFERSLYRVNISENAPLGTIILQMRANDSDSGRNGHIFYSMTGDNGVENVLLHPKLGRVAVSFSPLFL